MKLADKIKWRIAVLRTLVYVAAALVTIVTLAYWIGTLAQG